MEKVRTKMRPWEELEVDAAEAAYLRSQDMLVEGEAAESKSAGGSDTGNKTAGATGAGK